MNLAQRQSGGVGGWGGSSALSVMKSNLKSLSADKSQEEAMRQRNHHLFWGLYLPHG